MAPDLQSATILERNPVPVALEPAPAEFRPEWTRWFRCESSVSLALVPHRPGVYAVAHAIGMDAQGRRMLALTATGEAADLSTALARNLGVANSAGSYLRYAIVEGAADRRGIATALDRLRSQNDDRLRSQNDDRLRSQNDSNPPHAECSEPQQEAVQLIPAFATDCDPGDESEPYAAASAIARALQENALQQSSGHEAVGRSGRGMVPSPLPAGF